MDKNWIDKNRMSKEYINGITSFLDFAFANAENSNEIICPCKKCTLGPNNWFSREVVTEHLMFNGFLPGYKEWVFHGEPISTPSFPTSNSQSHRYNSVGGNPVDDDNANHFGHVDAALLLNDLYRQGLFDNDNDNADDVFDIGDHVIGQYDDDIINELGSNGVRNEGDNLEDAGYRRLLEQAEQELYPGSKYSKLAFLLNLFHLKSMHGWSIKSFDMLLELILAVFPQINPLPSKWSKCKQLNKDLGLGYEKIHACPNDCILYWDGRENQDECDKCHTSRCKDEAKKSPQKVLRYFPLTPRLRRIYRSSKIAEDMVWHETCRTKDGILRHPADGVAWKEFDEKNPDFASDPRNVRLALASDGFNPFRLMSSTHSTWPVLLIPYNLPPWLCMKPSSIILSMIIPGEKAPGMDIDVYLQPLVKELMQLWEGVEAFDAYTKSYFNLRVALHSTINDFPAYANLSGWSTKGRFACPTCAENTHSMWLENGRKFSYMGHRKWLPHDHPFRYDDAGFDGTIELDPAPMPTSGEAIVAELEGVTFSYGKGATQPVHTDEKDEVQVWKKKSIFFDLPYWRFNRLHHNLDVMHIEKNVTDNFLGTFLNLKGKSKDNLMARRDLQAMNIRPELHPIPLSNGDNDLPDAPYTFTIEEKKSFLRVLKNVKVPDWYGSNISRCVNLKDRKLFNMKSHDCHILMQDLLPIALRAAKDNELIDLISALSTFFKELCAKELSVEKLKEMKDNVVVILCRMEQLLPPGFFTIMVHLIIHLADEAILGGPVFYRWMYPIERFLACLKALVHNRAHSEASMAEGYHALECITFCSRYFQGVETIFNRLKRNDDSNPYKHEYLFGSGGQPRGEVKMFLDELSLVQAHRYVLLQFDNIDEYHRVFLTERKASFPSEPSDNLQKRWLIEEFPSWLEHKVSNMDINEPNARLLKMIARRPNSIAKRMTGYAIGG